VGFDPDDPQTAASAGNIPVSYLDQLSPAGLVGKRIGVIEELLIVEPEDAPVAGVIGRAAAELGGLGAELVRIRIPALWSLLSTRIDGFFVLVYDFRHDFNAYLADHPEAPVRTLEDVLMSGRYHPSLDEYLRLSLAMGEDSRADYTAELEQRGVLRDAVLNAMARHQLDALIYPTLRQTAAPLGEAQGRPAVVHRVRLDEPGILEHDYYAPGVGSIKEETVRGESDYVDLVETITE